MASYNHVYRPPHRVVYRPRTATLRLPLVLTQTLTSGLSFVSPLVVKSDTKALAGTLNTSGISREQINRIVAGAISFLSIVLKRFSTTELGGVSFTSIVRRASYVVRVGVLSSIGIVIKAISSVSVAMVSFVSTLISLKAFTRTLTRSLAFVAIFSKRLARSMIGALSFVGIATRKLVRTMIGGLSFATRALQVSARKLLGTLSLANTLMRTSPKKILLSALNFASVARESLARKLSGALSFVGIFSTVSGLSYNAVGGLTMIGALRKLTSRPPFVAILSFASIVRKSLSRSLTGAISFAGSIRKSIARLFTGVISFVGSLSTLAGLSVSMLGTLSLVGSAVKRATTRIVTSTLTFASPPILRAFEKALQGMLSFTSVLEPFVGRLVHLISSFNPFGTIFKHNQRAIHGALSTLSGLSLGSGLLFYGAANFESLVFKTAAKRTIAGFVFFAANLLLSGQKVLRGILSFAGAFAGSIAGVPAIVKIDAFLSEAVVNTLKGFERLISYLTLGEASNKAGIYENTPTHVKLREEIIHPHDTYERTRD